MRHLIHRTTMIAFFLLLSACGGGNENGSGGGGGGGGNKPPTAVIAEPTGRVAFYSSDIIHFTANAYDAEDGTLTGSSLAWTSSIDGQIGTGASFDTTISEGTHTITLTATDSSGSTTQRTVVVSTVDSSLTELGTLESNMVPQGIMIVGNLAYVADKYYGLHIIDVSSPDNPAVIGRLDTAGEANRVSVNGQYAFLAEGYDPYFTATASGALRIIDTSTPSSPKLVGSYRFTAPVNDVETEGNLAFVVTGGYGGQGHFVILDISVPGTPVELSNIKFPGQTVDVEIEGDFAFVVGNQTGLRIIDISNPSSPIEIGMLNMDDPVNDVEIIGNIAYVANDISGIQIVDISDLTKPVITTTIPASGVYAQAFDVEVQGNRVTVAELNAGVTIYDIADPSSPVVIDNIDTGATYELEVLGSMIYVADSSSGLQILDASIPGRLAVAGRIELPGHFPVIDIQGTRAYIGDTNLGLRIVDITEPDNLSVLGSLSFAPSVPQQGSLAARDVEAAGSTVYFVTLSSIKIVDASDPANPVKIGEIPSFSSEDIEVVGSTAFLADRDTLRILDVSDPGAVAELARVNLNGSSSVLEVAGNTAYIAYGRGLDAAGILIVDVTEPAAPTTVGNLDLGITSGNQVFDFKVVGNRIFALTAGLGMLAVDISDPANPVQISHAGGISAYSASQMAILGDKAYLAGNFMKIAVLTDPANMAALTTDTWIPENWDIVMQDRLFYVADRQNGLRVLQ